MKIVIIGGGIAGLSTYLFLRKHVSSLLNQHHEIKIYEAYDISKYIDKSCTPALSTNVSGNTNETSSGNTDVKENSVTSPSPSLTGPTFTPEAIASAIGISRNGLDVLSRLLTDSITDSEESEERFSEILADMLREGHPATKWQMRNARGWLLAEVDMLPKRLREKAKPNNEVGEKKMRNESASTDREESKGKWKDSPISTIMISRQAFWSILLKYVVAKDGKEVIQQKKVTELFIPVESSEEKTIIKFADGSEEAADLVIGADGLRSVVRKAMCQPEPQPPTSTRQQEKTSFISWLLSFVTRSQSTAGKDFITPHYESLVGVGSFIPSSLLSSTGVPPGTMSIVFGPNGFMGYGYITSKHTDANAAETAKTETGDVAVFWSTFHSSSENPFPLPRSTEAGRRARPHEFDHSAALRALLSKHKSWKNPTIQSILKYTEEEGGIDGIWPTWTTPELPTWSKNGKLVLVGDAAHALQPSSGQGANQALEDAESLSLLLKHYLSGRAFSSPEPSVNDSRGSISNDRRAIKQALSKFDALRLPRLHKIYARSQKMSGMKSDMGFVTEMMMYAAIWVMMKLHDGLQEELLGYDLPAEVERIIEDKRKGT